MDNLPKVGRTRRQVDYNSSPKRATKKKVTKKQETKNVSPAKAEHDNTNNPTQSATKNPETEHI
jgi:hypothetical protein